MDIIRNTDVAESYHVSDPTVGKWISASLSGKNNLQVKEVKGRYFILDNENNHRELKFLSQKGKKYKNKIGLKKHTVDQSISSIFSESQMVELITNLKSKKQIPLKFSYLNKGSDFWVKYIEADLSYGQDGRSYMLEAISLIEANINYLKFRFSQYRRINIVDIFPGNAILSKVFISELLKYGFEVEYTAYDISENMLQILKKNLTEIFPNIEIKTEIGDLDYMVIRDKLFFNKSPHAPGKSCNLVLLLNSIIGNTSDRHRVLKNIRDSMTSDDFLLIHNGLKYEGEHAELDGMTKNKWILTKCLWIPEAIGLTKDTYKIVSKFDEKTESRVIVLALVKDVEIRLKVQNKIEEIKFSRGDEITVWNYYSYTLTGFINELNKSGFETIHVTTYPDKSEAFILCE
ncbi:MAG: hypothetical protein OHK0017_01160 [Patescibacteria group bacterium]